MVDFDKRHSKELVKIPVSDLEPSSRSFRPIGIGGFIKHVLTGIRMTYRRIIDWVYVNDFRQEIAKARAEGNHEKARKLRAEQEKQSLPRQKKAMLAFGALSLLFIYVYVAFGALLLTAGVLLAATAVGLLSSPEVLLEAFGKGPEEEGSEPFSISSATNAEAATDCLSRALAAEGITVRKILEPKKYHWGWEFPVIMKKGTPQDIQKKAARLETLMRLPKDGLLISDTQFRAEVIVRLVQSDPFIGIDGFPYAEPLSRSIKNKYKVAMRMDGEDISLSLLRSHAVVIAAPGGGKSMFMRALADITTSCRDCVTWDIDPGGNGLEVFGKAISRSGREQDEIKSMLEDAIEYAKIRAKKLTQLGMGDNWQPSKEHPALVIFIDEFIQLNKENKDLAVSLIRIGRKAAISVILAAQQATKDVLGAAIADSVSLKVMFSSRHADVPIVFGEGMLASGWRPDRLHPVSGDDPQDAGKCYIMGGGSREPYLYKVMPLEHADALERGRERAAEGMVRIDNDTLDGTVVFDESETPLFQNVLDIFENFDENDWLPANIIVKELRSYGIDLTAKELHEKLGDTGRDSKIWEGSKYKIAGYYRTAIEKKLGE